MGGGNGHSWGRGVVLLDFPDELTLVAFDDAPLVEGEPLTPDAARVRLGTWLASGRAGRLELLEVASLVGRTAPETPQQRQALQSELSGALHAGSLRLFSRRMAPPHPVAPRQPFASPLTPNGGPAREKKTWIAIRLVDESDPPKPVPFKRYRIELPDASVREGKLDANGEARFLDIDPGTCTVSFPDQDASEWRVS